MLCERARRRREISSACLTEKGMAFESTQPARKWVPPLGSYKLATDPAPAVGGGFGAWRQARRWGRSQQWRGTSTACWHLVLPTGHWTSSSRYEETLNFDRAVPTKKVLQYGFLGGFYHCFLDRPTPGLGMGNLNVIWCFSQFWIRILMCT